LKTGLGGLGAAWGLLAPAAASAAGFDESAIVDRKYKSSGEKQKCTRPALALATFEAS